MNFIYSLNSIYDITNYMLVLLVVLSCLSEFNSEVKYSDSRDVGAFLYFYLIM